MGLERTSSSSIIIHQGWQTTSINQTKMEKPVSSFVFWCTFLCIMTAAAADCFWSGGWLIDVANENKEKIQVHCKSKEDDIGMKSLGFHEDFDWKFCENIISPSTLYFCHFYRGNQQQVFDVYNSTVKPFCAEHQLDRKYWRCSWVVKPDGFYIIDHKNGGGQIKMHDWQTGRV